MRLPLHQDLRCFLISTIVFAASCGDGGSSAPSPSDAAPPDAGVESDFIFAYATTVCDGAARCCAALAVPLNRDTCMREISREAQGILAPKATTSTFDAAHAADCIAHMRAAIDACVTSSAIQQANSFACRFVKVGSTEPGGSCTVDQDCAPSSEGMPRCYAFDTGRRCVIDTLGQQGQACGPLLPGPSEPNISHSFCAEGLYCAGSCKPVTPVGGDCTTDFPCGTKRYCESTTNTCQPQLDIGSPCTAEIQCQSSSCRGQTCVLGESIAKSVCFQ